MRNIQLLFLFFLLFQSGNSLSLVVSSYSNDDCSGTLYEMDEYPSGRTDCVPFDPSSWFFIQCNGNQVQAILSSSSDCSGGTPLSGLIFSKDFLNYSLSFWM